MPSEASPTRADALPIGFRPTKVLRGAITMSTASVVMQVVASLAIRPLHALVGDASRPLGFSVFALAYAVSGALWFGSEHRPSLSEHAAAAVLTGVPTGALLALASWGLVCPDCGFQPGVGMAAWCLGVGAAVAALYSLGALALARRRRPDLPAPR